jgi:hypothetical protein
MWTPRLNRRGWHVSGTAVFVMVVLPLLWPVLALLVAVYVFYAVLWVVLFVAGNVVAVEVALVRALCGDGRARVRAACFEGSG